MGDLLAAFFAVLFWAGIPAFVWISQGHYILGVLWGIFVGIAVGGVLVAESNVRSPCHCNHKCKPKRC
jgi:ABC-type Co2+ transport system permease subunit